MTEMPSFTGCCKHGDENGVAAFGQRAYLRQSKLWVGPRRCFFPAPTSLVDETIRATTYSAVRTARAPTAAAARPSGRRRASRN